MSKNYLRYLVSSKKVLLIFLGLAQLLIYVSALFTSTGTVYGQIEECQFVLMVMVNILVFALPVYFMAYINNRKAVDVYMSLPVKRSQIVVTTLLFELLIIAVPQIVVIGIDAIYFGAYIGTILKSCLLLTCYAAVMLLFNTGLYLIGNNLIDSLVIIAAYNLLPFILELVVNAFTTTMVYGIDMSSSWLMDCCSLVYSNCDKLVYITEEINPDLTYSTSWLPYVICSIVYVLIGLYSMKKNFIERKMERTESITDDFFGYKFLIYFITPCMILITTFSVSTDMDVLSIVTSCLPVYIVIVVLFFVALFIYKRKLEVKVYSIVYILVVIAISVGFTKIAWDNEGFGLSYKYDHNPTNLMISGSAYVENNGTVSNVYDEEMSSSYYDLYITLDIKADNKNKDETVSLINELRDCAIHNYFKDGISYNGLWLGITTNYHESDDYWKYDYDNNSYGNIPLTVDIINRFKELGASIEIDYYEYDNVTYEYKEAKTSLDEFIRVVERMEV